MLLEKQLKKEEKCPTCVTNCHCDSCSHLMSNKEFSLCGSSFGLRRCFKCGGIFCVNCNVPRHSKLSCNNNKKLCPNNFEDAVDYVMFTHGINVMCANTWNTWLSVLSDAAA
ncbi:hypothetical protein YC2023_122855 [Brassica napus]